MNKPRPGSVSTEDSSGNNNPSSEAAITDSAEAAKAPHASFVTNQLPDRPFSKSSADAGVNECF
jgi:hypothetical protein